jgi:hypothetical protein
MNRDALEQWHALVAQVVGGVQFPDYDFACSACNGNVWINVQFTEKSINYECRPREVPFGMNPGQIVELCFEVVMASLTERARVAFTCEGRRPFKPLCNQVEFRPGCDHERLAGRPENQPSPSAPAGGEKRG